MIFATRMHARMTRYRRNAIESGVRAEQTYVYVHLLLLLVYSLYMCNMRAFVVFDENESRVAITLDIII